MFYCTSCLTRKKKKKKKEKEKEKEQSWTEMLALGFGMMDKHCIFRSVYTYVG